MNWLFTVMWVMFALQLLGIAGLAWWCVAVEKRDRERDREMAVLMEMVYGRAWSHDT